MVNRNEEFLSAVDSKTRDEILASIANHYGITTEEAYAEVADEKAEPLLDYLVEPHRSAASGLMQRHGMHIMAINTELAPRFIRSAHGVYLIVDGDLPLDESRLEGCTTFVNRPLMVEDMFYEPAQNCYSSTEDADAAIYRVMRSKASDEVVLVDDRGIASPLDTTIEDFLNTYQL